MATHHQPFVLYFKSLTLRKRESHAIASQLQQEQNTSIDWRDTTDSQSVTCLTGFRCATRLRKAKAHPQQAKED